MRHLCFLLFLSTLNVFSQNTDEKLAAQYFSEKAYSKAADIYEDLAKQEPESIYYYDYLLQCYILLKDYRSAEKMVDRRVKKFENQLAYRVDQAYLFNLQEENEKRDKVFKELLDYKFRNSDEADNLANGFMKRKFYEQAIKTYINARKQLKDDNLFSFELSELYFYNSLKKEGTDELINIAFINDYLIGEVKDRLVVSYSKKDDYNILTENLLLRLQKRPDNLAYNELLIWAFTQQRDWNGAFIQARAVDKRLREDGKKVLELTGILIVNEEYDLAIKSFEYIKSLGENKAYYFQARQGILNCGILQVRAQHGAPIETLRKLENEYLTYLTGNLNYESVDQIKELAELYIYYLHEPQKGINQLNKALSIPGVPPKLLAACKLDLGDAQLIIGESWEADLLYKQVEKSFNTDALGQEAKLRYARLCFFRGDFAWSQSQLDVLKEATSQLISNNAMKLWLIIQDNMGMDSSEEALKLYAKAELLIFQNKLDEAIVLLDELPILFPNHTLIDEIYFSKAVISEKQNKYQDAEVFYIKVIKDYSFDILADNALINLARMYEFKMNDTAKAKKLYENIILNYTGSLFANEARSRFRYLRGDILQENQETFLD